MTLLICMYTYIKSALTNGSPSGILLHDLTKIAERNLAGIVRDEAKQIWIP